MKKIILVLFLTFISLILQAKEHIFKIDGGTFDLDIYIFHTDNYNKVEEGVLLIAGDIIDSSFFNARGITLYSKGYPIIVWFPEKVEEEVIDHEIFHIVASIMDWANIPLNYTTEEVYAYETGYLSKNIKEKLHVR